MALEQLKTKHYRNRFQYLLIEIEGQVLESDNTLFNIEAGQSIKSIHPFFESVLTVLNGTDDFQFSCINVTINAVCEIFDI